MYGYIYKTTNKLNNKIYIGQKKSEIFLNNSYLGSGKYLKHAIEKYGKDNFLVELLDTANSRNELSELEIYYIQKYNSTNRDIGYNIAKGGIGGGEIYVHNEYENRFIPKSSLKAFIEDGWQLGMLPGRKELNHSKTRGSNISKALTGKRKTAEHAKKHRESLKNRHAHWYTNGISNILIPEVDSIPKGYYKGKTVSQEFINKCKTANIGKIPWNKGLTKETDVRILKGSIKAKDTLQLKRK